MSAAAKQLAGGLVGAASLAWPAYSRLFLVGDRVGWSVSRDMLQVGRVARRLGARLGPGRLAQHVRVQSVFYGSQFVLLDGSPLPEANRLAVAYFHGRPGTPGYPEFDRAYESLRAGHELLERVQVTHAEMRELVLATGIAPEKVFTIPIGIDLAEFRRRDDAARLAARERLGIPESAVLVGSLQKDGIGWGEGDEPKLVKGPDVLVDALARLRERVPELWVLLGGPGRGWVKRRLDELGIPYRHVVARDFAEVPRLFQALDLYLVASRQEGGPKALFESWATGVPLVTTRVGQAGDLVRHGENGWLAEVDDPDGLAHWAEQALAHPEDARAAVEHARRDVEAYDYEAQSPLWRRFLEGFVRLSA